MCEQNIAPQMNEELKQKAMEHDMTDIPEIDLKAACEAVEKGAVSTYQKIENGVVGGYKKIETGVVDGFTKMTDKIVEKFLTREGETVEEAKQRMNGAVHK